MRFKTTNNKSIGIWHGHATPAVDVITADLTISAHVHPAYSFRDNVGSIISEKIWVKAKWIEKKKAQRTHLIMPAFNSFIDGLSVDHENFTEMLAAINGIDLLKGEAYTLDGVLLGTIGQLQAERKDLEEQRIKALQDLSSISRKSRGKKRGKS
jgi:metallophosphoesterase superfamily enzyme